VEIEVNGIMTYDRQVVKLPPDAKALHAALFSPPVVREVVAGSDRRPQQWRYTTTAPAATWFESAFDDAGWQQGAGGFGKPDTSRARVGTPWLTPDIWIRRTFDVPSRTLVNPHLRIYHDDDAEVYVNGERIAELPGAVGGYSYVRLDDRAAALLRGGQPNVLAIHVKQLKGGQFVDAGIVEVVENR
jgi:hypothetical protein